MIDDFWDFAEHNLDGKGRLVLPAAFRDSFADGGVLSLRGDHAALHTHGGWEKARRDLDKPELFSPMEQRWVKSFVTRVGLDTQSRIPITSRLRNEIGLVKEAVVIGLGPYVAIYPLATWQRLDQSVRVQSAGERPPLTQRLSELS